MATKTYRLIKCRILRLEGTLWGREVAFTEDWGEGEIITRHIYRALEPRNGNEWGRFEVSCMSWEEGDAWLPDHMGTWEEVVA
jgi:hypothetical protein